MVELLPPLSLLLLLLPRRPLPSTWAGPHFPHSTRCLPGRLFVTTRTTLTTFPHSMLAGMFRGDLPAGALFEGGIFIDRRGPLVCCAVGAGTAISASNPVAGADRPGIRWLL